MVCTSSPRRALLPAFVLDLPPGRAAGGVRPPAKMSCITADAARIIATIASTSEVSSSIGNADLVRGLTDGWNCEGRTCIASPRIHIGADARRVLGEVRRRYDVVRRARD